MLHVYLDGDGTPELAGYPAVDPTPREPLVLDLMALDGGPAIYLGRPCYHGLADRASCVPALWTSARYSDTVVASMAAVARRVIAARDVERVVWIGYSGGGVLAALLARRMPETVGLVTIAANLDIDAWSDARGAPRLVDSLNPASQPALPPGVRQRHYAGGRDELVRPAITRQGVGPGAELVVVADYDHRCCWVTLWPDVLTWLDRESLVPRPRGRRSLASEYSRTAGAAHRSRSATAPPGRGAGGLGGPFEGPPSQNGTRTPSVTVYMLRSL